MQSKSNLQANTERGLNVEKNLNIFLLSSCVRYYKTISIQTYHCWSHRLEDKRLKTKHPIQLITLRAWHVLWEEWIDWMAMLTVIGWRGCLLTKTALACAAASGRVETACARCAVHSCHLAVTYGDLVRVGFVAVGQKANEISHFNSLQEKWRT